MSDWGRVGGGLGQWVGGGCHIAVGGKCQSIL